MRILPLVLLTACFRLDTSTAVPLDILLDRPRVIAMSYDPPVAAANQPVTVSSLILGAPGEEPESVDVSTCGLRDDVAVRVGNVRCFNNAELVESVSSTLPFTWTPPDRTALECGDEEPEEPEDTDDVDTDDDDTGLFDTGIFGGERYVRPGAYYGCTSYVPLMTTANFGREQAKLMSIVPIRHAEWPEDIELPKPVMSRERTITVVGDLRPGQDVELRFEIEQIRPDEFSRVRWYVDRGLFLRTGRTTIAEQERGKAIAVNMLRLAEDDPGGPLRIVVVVDQREQSDGFFVDSAWLIHTVEVAQ